VILVEHKSTGSEDNASLSSARRFTVTCNDTIVRKTSLFVMGQLMWKKLGQMYWIEGGEVQVTQCFMTSVVC
jgi:hypothetical protein